MIRRNAEMDAVQPLNFVPNRRRSRLASVGDWMAQHRRSILAVQWVIVVFYALLVVLPAFLPHPRADSRLFSGDLVAWHERLVLLAQYLFWGVWWPFVILSMMLVGRLWCGVLCPEGALAEFASRHGRGGAIPRWVRWGGWPVVGFVLTTLYGQLISVYEYPQAALVILGGSTVAAIVIGWLYGRGKRVWCRYLCPVTGVFALLSRLAPVHFRVDPERWNAYPERPAAVDCAPLVNVSTLQSASQCHSCGRCSGHRDAVDLVLRSPNAEVLSAKPPQTNEAILLIFGLLGVAIGAFQWTVSPYFVQAKTAIAGWLIERDILWALQAEAPWWLLTHYPDAGDVFSWLDGAGIVAYIGLVTLTLGGGIWLAVLLAARLARLDWRALALGLTPLAGIGLFLGLSMMSVNHLRGEGVLLAWLPVARAALLALGALWSAWLGARLIVTARPGLLRAALALAAWAAPIGAVVTAWIFVFYIW